MNNHLKIMLALGAMAVMTGCGCESQVESSSPKYLILYYSQTGTTQAVAEMLQEQLGADIESIVAELPYDGSYDQTIERGARERENGVPPAVKPLNVNIDDYDVIFLGYPVWFGTYALPVSGLLATEDFAGKKLVPFCTFGSGGLESSVADLKEALPEAEILEGYGVRTARIAAAAGELERFLIEKGYLEGEIEPLPEYSEQEPVTDEDVAVFDEACSGYRFPLGTPVSVAKRSTADGTDYLFEVETPDGGAGTTIYVSVGNEEGAAAEFTRVVRK